MAIYERTNRGIEYNTDGYDEADVLKDMKHLAETTDNAIENAVQEATYDDTSVKSRLTTAEGKISNIEAEQNTQNTNISANASAINALQGTVQAQGQTLEQHTTEIDTTNQNITNLTGRVSTNEEDIADIKEEQTTQNTNIEELQNQVETLQEDLESANAEISELNTDITNMAKAMYKVDGQGSDITLPNTSENKFVEFGLEGRTEQEQLSGKNFLPFPYTSQNEYIDDKGKVILNGTISSNFSIAFNTFKLPAGTYIFSFKNSNDSIPNNCYGLIRNEDESVWINANMRQYSYSFTLQNETTISTGIVIIAGAYSNLILEPMLRLSSVTDGTWEPYTNGLATPNPNYIEPIKNVTGNANVKIQNKNLFNYTKYLNLVTNYEYEDGVYHCKSILLKPNTQYTVSFPTKEATSIVLLINNTPHVNDIGYFDTRKTSDTKIFTTDSTGNLYIGVLYSSDSAVNDLLENLHLQIEEGTTATSYVPHQEQNYPFTFSEGQRAMQGTQLLDDGIHHKRARVVLDGTENWQLATNPDFLYLEIITKKADNEIMIISSHFKGVSFNDRGNGETNIIYSTGTYIVLRNTEFTTINELKTFLAEQYANGTPVILEYELAESELENNIIPYNATQQAQYDAIKEATSEDDITIISSESDELGFNMNVVAVADANKVIDNQNSEIDTIKSRLDLLEG